MDEELFDFHIAHMQRTSFLETTGVRENEHAGHRRLTAKSLGNRPRGGPAVLCFQVILALSKVVRCRCLFTCTAFRTANLCSSGRLLYWGKTVPGIGNDKARSRARPTSNIPSM